MTNLDKLKVLNDIDKNYLKSKTAYALPSNPSNKGLSASQIISKMADGTMILFDWLQQAQKQTNRAFDQLSDNIKAVEPINVDESISQKFVALKEELRRGLAPVYTYVQKDGKEDKIYNIEIRTDKKLETINGGEWSSDRKGE